MSLSKVFVILAVLATSHTVIESKLTNGIIKQSLVTEYEAKHLSYEWTIKNFTLLSEKTKCYNSSDLRSGDGYRSWKLSFCPKLRDDEGYYALFDLHPSTGFSRDEADQTFMINGELSILKSNQVIANRTFQRQLVGRGVCAWPPVASRKDCIEYHYDVRLSELLSGSDSNDNITMRLEIDMPLNLITKTIDVTAPIKKEIVCEPPKRQLNEDFGRLLKDEKFSDVEIIVGSQKFSAHSNILAVRSPVFAKSFENVTRNIGGKFQVTIQNMEPAVMTAILEYIYTDNVSNLDELPLTSGLLAAADEFELPNLKTICEEVLHKKLDADNVADILVLADRYGLPKLKRQAMEFIRNHFPDVMETEGYKKMKDKFPALLMEIMFSRPDRRYY